MLGSPPCDADAEGTEGAQVGLARGRLVLFLCGHHFRQYELALLTEGWRVTHDSRVDGW